MPEIVTEQSVYDWKITLKKMLKVGLQAVLIAILPITIDYFKGIESVVPVEYLAWIGLAIAALTGLLNWLKNKDKVKIVSVGKAKKKKK